MNRLSRIIILLIIIIILISISFHYRIRDRLYQISYDFRNPNPRVNFKDTIQDILQHFQQIKHNELPEEYLNYTKSNQFDYQKLLKGKTYYLIGDHDIYKRIVGNFRIKHFIVKDSLYKQYILGGKDYVTLCKFVSVKLEC